MKIKILAVGKLKEKAYQNRIGEYVKWINRDIPVELIFLKDNDKVNKKLLAHINSADHTICLSEEGDKRSSKEFSKLLFNKALEIIEASVLFNIKSDKIEVTVHPEHIIHGLVHYKDGSILANLGFPDMILSLIHI